MGNSKLAQGCQTPTGQPSRDADLKNGILAQVPGDVIGRGLSTLPPPSAPGSDRHQVTVQVAHLGEVLLFVERKRARHGRHSHTYWQAYRAELADSVTSESN